MAAERLRCPSLVLWSVYKDSNLGPPAPKAGALPDCATHRYFIGRCDWDRTNAVSLMKAAHYRYATHPFRQHSQRTAHAAPARCIDVAKPHQHISAGIQESSRRPTLQTLTKWSSPTGFHGRQAHTSDNAGPQHSHEYVRMLPTLSA